MKIKKQMNKTLGEHRVRTEFNPANDTLVDKIKQKSAELIDLTNSISSPTNMVDVGEFIRIKALGMTAYEEAAMWAVKACTFYK